MLKIYPSKILLAAVFTMMATSALADHQPVEPFDLFIDPPEHHELQPDARSQIDDPILLPDGPSPLEEAEERQRLREELESNARAAEEAQRAARNNSLPTLSTERDERLAQLFEILKSTENPILAERAQAEIERIWQVSGSDTIDLLLNWANVAMENRQFGKALDYLDNIIRLKPDFAEGWNRRATLYFMQEKFGLSVADVERTLELEPRQYNALAGLATMMRELGNDEQALFAFKKALAINPSMTQINDVIKELEKKVKGRGI